MLNAQFIFSPKRKGVQAYLSYIINQRKAEEEIMSKWRVQKVCLIEYHISSS